MGLRVIINERHQSALVQQIYEDHFGIVRTKAIARNYFRLRSAGETTAETSDEESTTLVSPGHDKDGVAATPTRAAPSHAATLNTSMSPSKCACTTR